MTATNATIHTGEETKEDIVLNHDANTNYGGAPPLTVNQFQLVVEGSTYMWLHSSLPQRFGGPKPVKTADDGAEETELDANKPCWQNWVSAWLILACQLTMYIALSVLTGQKIKHYQHYAAGVQSCDFGDAIGIPLDDGTTVAAPKCVAVERADVAAYFVGFLLLLSYTYNDRLAGVLLWQIGLRLAGLAVWIVLLAAYVATGLVVYLTLYNGGSNIEIITTSVGIIFISDLDEKMYVWLKAIKHPNRRLVAIVEILVMSIGCTLLYMLVPVDDYEYKAVASSSTASDSGSS